MSDYKTMYFTLFNRVTDAICLLQEAQREAEAGYELDNPKPILTLLDGDIGCEEDD